MENLQSELQEMMNVFDNSNKELKSIIDSRAQEHNANTINLSSAQLMFDKRVNETLQQMKEALSKSVSEIHLKLDANRREVNL